MGRCRGGGREEVGGGRARDVRGVRPARVLIAPSPAVFVREHVQANLSPMDVRPACEGLLEGWGWVVGGEGCSH